MNTTIQKEIEAGLNTQQKEALYETDKPVLILAGAGSGKTRVITYKIAYLVQEKRVNPWNILAVTFTNKAANEMKERVKQLLSSSNLDSTSSGSASSSPMSSPIEELRHGFWVSTFHSACARILRKEIPLLGWGQNFSIYDSIDSKRLIQDILKEKNLSVPERLTVQSILHQISKYKRKGILPKHLAEQKDPIEQLISEIYKNYEKKLWEHNALDFDDLMNRCIDVLEKHEDRLHYYRNLFQYILVDEFQDTNESQYRLIELLGIGKTGISVVGDDDQAIYSWRGAQIENMFRFQKDFPSCSIIKLEENYRSPNSILQAAGSLIQKNSKRMDKTLWSKKPGKETLYFYRLPNDRIEAHWIREKLLSIEENGTKWSEMAVFYRMHYQSRVLEEELNRQSIPYRIYGGTPFYERMEMKDLISYLRILVNPKDWIPWRRIIHVPRRGIGEKTLAKIQALGSEKNLSFQESAIEVIERSLIGGSTQKKLRDFLQWLDRWKKETLNKNLVEISDSLIEAIDYKKYLNSYYDHYEERLENIRELKRAMEEYEFQNPTGGLEGFLNQSVLTRDFDGGDSEENNFLALMTLHNSKGLEFETVFILGLSEGLLPHSRSQDNLAELEEERRLLYVGMTRAKKTCLLSSAMESFRYSGVEYYLPSRFISEIDPQFIQELDAYPELSTKNGNNLRPQRKEAKNPFSESWHKESSNDLNDLSQKENSIKDISNIEIGDTLKHHKFGIGQVLEIHPKDNLSTVLVQFTDGNRLLILKYASLSKI